MKKLLAILITLISTIFGNESMKNDYSSYIKKFLEWEKSKKINISELTEIRTLYLVDCINNLKTYYDGSPLHGIVIEVNQNYSISIWAETENSHKEIVQRFRSQSSGYENKTDKEIYESITPWYYDSFKYECLEFKCTKKLDPLVEADSEFCESYEGDDLKIASETATINAIINLEKSKIITVIP